MNELEMMKTKEYRNLLMRYECALKEVSTKFQVLDTEFSVRYHRNPIEIIKTRLKSENSILEKIKRRGLTLDISTIKEDITDVAGIRVICSFRDDIYALAQMISKQDDIKVLMIKDYIKNPKINGYRSLHLIINIPIFLSENKEYIPVEIQFRTIAMDFWASLEHKTKYKKNIENPEKIFNELKECAEQISEVDLKMQKIHKLTHTKK